MTKKEIMEAKEIMEGNKLIAKFMGYKYYPNDSINGNKGVLRKEDDADILLDHTKQFSVKYHFDWNRLMEVVDKIETIIESKIEIHHTISISWSYSPKKTGTFQRGAGGGGGGTVERKPFESIFGKFHQIHSYYGEGFKFKPKLKSSTKKEALWKGCVEFIKWYNKTVLTKSKKKKK